MKVCGIIAEFNPLHNAHQYLCKQAREQFGADYIVIVMSGDHVQRGEPAIADKYIRSRAALLCGADLVLELPVCFATGSAQYFARGAVSALLSTGMIDFILFGSESGDITMLKDASDLEYSLRDKEYVLPNNQLALEYIKAREYFTSAHPNTMQFETIARIGKGHLDSGITDEYTSATHLRDLLFHSTWEQINSLIPSIYRNDLSEYFLAHSKMSFSSYDSVLFYSLHRERLSGYDDYFDVFPDLSDKINKNLNAYQNVTQFRMLLKTKDITYSHISRALLHILLGIKETDVNILISKYHYCAYLRILGVNQSASALLNGIKSNSSVPLIAKLADANHLLDTDAMNLLNKDIFASELYQYTSTSNQKACIHSEYRQKVITIKSQISS